ncbi:hypothetical protein ACF9IK_31915 [Kitasatospora hibisci]|uniref:hypothetical protein n=1 Tax=Kitasatospora hibisci TaxID=3369522 RepID=UPI003754EA03
MKTRTAPAAAAVTALAVVSLAACGAGSGGPATGSATAPVTASAGATAPGVPAAPRHALPEPYDNGKGWAAKPEDGSVLSSPIVAPGAGLVLFRSVSADLGTERVVARDARTGVPRWSSRPAKRSAGSAGGFESTDASLLLTHDHGRELVVLASGGVEGAATVTRLAVFDPAGASGDQAAPLREVTVSRLRTGALTASWENGLVTVPVQDGVVVVDVTSGQVTVHDRQSPARKAPKPCPRVLENCDAAISRIVGATSAGPLVEGYQAFWSGPWISDDVVPPEAAGPGGVRGVRVWGTGTGDVLAAWPTKDDAPDRAVWALHGGADGKVLASVTCAVDGTPGEPFLTGGGRYLVAGAVVFDTRSGQGFCFEPSASRTGTRVRTVDPEGTAYGSARSGAALWDGKAFDRSPASIDLAAGGRVSDQAAGTLVPDRADGGVAVIGGTTASGGVILVYPHR